MPMISNASRQLPLAHSTPIKERGILLTLWLLMLLLRAGWLMYNNLTHFASQVATDIQETHWSLLGSGLASCCEIIGLLILFTSRKWAFAIVVFGVVCRVMLMFFPDPSLSPPPGPSTPDIIFSFVALALLAFLLSREE